MIRKIIGILAAAVVLTAYVPAGIAASAETYEIMTIDEALDMLRNGNMLPSVGECTLEMSAEYVYTGEDIFPELKVISPKGETLREGEDYFLRCFGCVDAGDAFAVVTGINGWSGSKTADYEILPFDASDAAKITVKNAKYTGEAVTPSVQIKLGEKTLVKDKDYTVRSDSYKVGKGSADIKFIGNYCGSAKAEFDILPADISAKAVVSVGDVKYTGEAVKPAVTVTLDGTALAENEDYTVKCSSYKVGKGVAEISFIGNYSGSVKAEFNITIDTPKASQLSAKLNEQAHKITLEWNGSEGADGYILKRTDGKEKTLGEFKDGGSFVYEAFTEGDKCVFSLTPWVNDREGNRYFGEACIVTVQTHTVDRLFSLGETVDYFNMDKTYAGKLYAGFYSGCHYSNDKKYAVVDLCGGKYLVSRSKLTERKGAKALQTGAIGQMGGEIYGQASCGPTAAAILVNWQLNEDWSKDDLIRFCERNGLNDQGSLRGGGGMTAPRLIELIDRFSGGVYKATNIYGEGGVGNTAGKLKDCIDRSKRALVVVQYTSQPVTHYSSGTHFIVVCGYEYIDGALYFYYADPYYGNGNRSLLRIHSSTLAASMDMVAREPRCMIIAEK